MVTDDNQPLHKDVSWARLIAHSYWFILKYFQVFLIWFQCDDGLLTFIKLLSSIKDIFRSYLNFQCMILVTIEFFQDKNVFSIVLLLNDIFLKDLHTVVLLTTSLSVFLLIKAFWDKSHTILLIFAILFGLLI